MRVNSFVTTYIPAFSVVVPEDDRSTYDCSILIVVRKDKLYRPAQSNLFLSYKLYDKLSCWGLYTLCFSRRLDGWSRAHFYTMH